MTLDLEVFKKMSKEEINAYGESLSEGCIKGRFGYELAYKNYYGKWYEYTRDERGNVLTYKNYDGYWYEYTRDESGNALTYKNSYGYWREYTRDESGRELAYKDSNGYWREYTYDERGNKLSLKDSRGYWEEYTRDENGNELTFKNSNGDTVVYFFWGKKYNLGYDANTKKYHAGCQELSYKECEKFYENNKDKFDDSHDFIEAIREHQKTLTESK